MQTFGLTLQMSLTAVVPQHFLDEARKEAQAPDASLFLKTIQEKFADDDDGFMLAIVKNALRTAQRHSAINFLTSSGVGNSVSPVQIVAESIHAGNKAVAEFAEASAGGAVPEASSKAIQLAGAAVADLVEARKE